MSGAVYVFPAALLALGAWCAWQAARGWWTDRRLADRIGEIARDQVRGVVEQITEARLSERRR